MVVQGFWFDGDSSLWMMRCMNVELADSISKRGIFSVQQLLYLPKATLQTMIGNFPASKLYQVIEIQVSLWLGTAMIFFATFHGASTLFIWGFSHFIQEELWEWQKTGRIYLAGEICLVTGRETCILSARIFPSKAIELILPKDPGPKYTPTSIIFVKVPSISKYEWHSFSITSSSRVDDNSISIMIKSEGSWTSSLSHMIQTRQESDGDAKKYIPIAVEGPYGPAWLASLNHFPSKSSSSWPKKRWAIARLSSHGVSQEMKKKAIEPKAADSGWWDSFFNPRLREYTDTETYSRALPVVIDYKAAIHFWKVDKFHFVACISAFIGVVFGNVQIGLVLAVAISVIRVLLFVARPNSMVYRNVEQCPNENNIVPGILILEIDAPIYFANTNYVRERTKDLGLNIDKWLIYGTGKETSHFCSASSYQSLLTKVLSDGATILIKHRDLRVSSF
ncbi:unnamed protein product [Prunus armeniaca]